LAANGHAAEAGFTEVEAYSFHQDWHGRRGPIYRTLRTPTDIFPNINIPVISVVENNFENEEFQNGIRE
jgi:hypothetical protein